MINHYKMKIQKKEKKYIIKKKLEKKFIIFKKYQKNIYYIKKQKKINKIMK